MKKIVCTIRGRVQMVLFRDFVQRNARSLRVVGEVTNNPDGTVTVIAVGEEDALRELIVRLHQGPVFARVDSVDVEWHNAQSIYDDFSITY